MKSKDKDIYGLFKKVIILKNDVLNELIPFKKRLGDEFQIMSVSKNDNLNGIISSLMNTNIKINNDRFIVKREKYKDFLTNEVEDNIFIYDKYTGKTSPFYSSDVFSENEMTKFANIIYAVQRFSNVLI